MRYWPTPDTANGPWPATGSWTHVSAMVKVANQATDADDGGESRAAAGGR